MTQFFRLSAALVTAGVACLATPGSTATVTLTGTVVNSCTLSPSGGTMVVSATGTELGSESGVGGAAATMSVLAAGTAPTLTFTAPASSLSGATAEIRYTHSGASQAYTSGSSTSNPALVDTYTIHGRLTKSTGFANGAHTVTTTVTCEQPSS